MIAVKSYFEDVIDSLSELNLSKKRNRTKENPKGDSWFTLLMNQQDQHKFERTLYGAKDVKGRLIEIFQNKCAFCECDTSAGAAYDVEHFRPKFLYYWLCYEWTNLLLSCRTCNEIHKKTQFPLENEMHRLQSHPVTSKAIFDKKACHPFDENLKILKAAVLYGNNGSGKSNFIQSLGFVKGFVLNSFRDALLVDLPNPIPVKPFLLNTLCERLPSYFEISFILGKTRYRYGFEVTAEKVCSEWLYHATTKEVPLFKREKDNIIVNKSSFKEGLGLETKIKNNVLFLTRIAHDKGTISNPIIDWFKNWNIISGIHDRTYKAYTIQKLKTDKLFKRWVSKFVAFLEIHQLSTQETDISTLDMESLREVEMDEDLNNLLSSIQKLQSKQPKREPIVTWHRRYDANNFLIDTIPFDFDGQESEGTKKLIYLLGPWYNTLKEGKILVVDELDSRLHPNLIKYLVAFFHETNRLRAQLIFVTHSTEILSKDYLRRDQIWFMEKDQLGASKMYSLGDFKSEQVRNKSAFDRNYIDGKYGGVPYFENQNSLIHSLYGEE